MAETPPTNDIQVTPTPPNPAYEQPTAQLTELTAKLKAAVDIMQEAKDEDGARWQKANEERQTLGSSIQSLRDRIDREDREKATVDAVTEMQAFLASTRAPSKASLIGGNFAVGVTKAERGAFLGALMGARSNDYEAQQRGKATLAEMGSVYQEAWGKATLGTTDATGGFIVPNSVTDDLIAPALYNNRIRTLLNVVSGVNGYGVEIPLRLANSVRAVIQPWGDVKENRNIPYNGYTATMYTLALIYDISAQFARKSQGAAEADVMSNLGNAMALGEAYYAFSGSGSSEPYGLLTALTASPATFTSSFTPSATTLAGSVAVALATMAGALANRNVQLGLSALMNAGDYWTMLSQGTDTAGFFFAPAGGPTAIDGIPTGTLVSPFGIPVYPEVGIASDRAVVGNFKSLTLYLGEGFRIDSSDTAGERWDRNLIGFRGEEEIGLDARPAVYAGNFQQVTNLIA